MLFTTLRSFIILVISFTTLSCLINVEGVINVNGGQKLHFNKRGGWGSGGKIINVEGGNL